MHELGQCTILLVKTNQRNFKVKQSAFEILNPVVSKKTVPINWVQCRLNREGRDCWKEEQRRPLKTLTDSSLEPKRLVALFINYIVLLRCVCLFCYVLFSQPHTQSFEFRSIFCSVFMFDL
ncbi:hypothetical protein V8G54_005143 [Vigna mungo]|uniref:Uncharacterized protein n=1 Tax=Vigna mungo TaxID=3915 RepID=A0AAQ3SH30_VIGMU